MFARSLANDRQQPPGLSLWHHPAMRRSFAFGLTFVIAVVLAAQIFSFGEALEYRRALAFAEPWRLLTSHFVHLTLLHAMLNALALLLLGRLFEGRLRPAEFFGILLAAPVVISLAFRWLLPELYWYRGLSDVLHAIYFAGCVVWIATATGRLRWIAIAALLAGTLKVLVEQPWDASFPVHAVLRIAVVPQAHLIGAVVGAMTGLLLRLRRRREQLRS
jgi:rhomboid family GlyGly-CTERM serine protease